MNDAGDLAAVDGLRLEQRLGDEVERTAVLRQQLVGPRLLLVEDAGHLVVDHLGGLVAVLAALGHQVLAEEHLLVAAPGHRPDALRSCPTRGPSAGRSRGLLEVVGGAGVEMTEDDLLGDATAHRPADDVLEVLLRVRVPLLRAGST